MLPLAKNQLRAALSHAAVKDIRYYINGVLLEVCANGDVHLVATDGHRIFCGLVLNPQWTDTPQKGPFSMIIPFDTVKAATKGKGDVTLSALPDGRYSLGDSIFSPVDGKFPDWRRVIPSGKGETSAQYNWKYINAASRAIKEWHDDKNAAANLKGDVMHGPDRTAFCVVMPMRERPFATPFKPASYE